MQISIIVPVYENEKSLAKLLRSIDKMNICPAVFEVVIIDNNKVPAFGLHIFEHCDRIKNFQIIHQPQPGSYAARNQGVLASKGQILAFTDADCEVSPTWLDRAEYLILELNANRVSGPVIVEITENESAAQWYDKITGFPQCANSKRGLSTTANLIIAKSFFLDVGLFNSKLLSGGDMEWNERANLKGDRLVYEATQAVNHPARATLTEIIKKANRVAGGIAKRRLNQSRWVAKCCVHPFVVATTAWNKSNLRGFRLLRVSGVAILVAIVWLVGFYLVRLKLVYPSRA